MSRRRRLAGISAAMAVVFAWFLVATPAYAQAPATGLLRVGHLSPTTPAVDVYVSAEGGAAAERPAAQGTAYGAVTAYETLAAGRYTVAMRPAGAPAGSPPAVTATVDVAAGSAQSLIFFDTGSGGAVQGEVLADSRSGAGAGAGLVRVVQGATGAGPVDIEAVGGPRLATDLPYGTATEYRSVAAKAWNVTVVAGSSRLRVALAVADGSVTTVLLSRAASGALIATPVVDAAGGGPSFRPGAPATAPAAAAVPVQPSGGVGAGAGGTAAGSDPLPIVAALGAALLLVCAVSGLRCRRC